MRLLVHGYCLPAKKGMLEQDLVLVQFVGFV
jgi:succinate dehydrogenase flavin-adding protein (antitoxin of CptAB toxin-antitoxin module)